MTMFSASAPFLIATNIHKPAFAKNKLKIRAMTVYKYELSLKLYKQSFMQFDDEWNWIGIKFVISAHSE